MLKRCRRFGLIRHARQAMISPTRMPSCVNLASCPGDGTVMAWVPECKPHTIRGAPRPPLPGIVALLDKAAELRQWPFRCRDNTEPKTTSSVLSPYAAERVTKTKHCKRANK